jgi:hypothetical protein
MIGTRALRFAALLLAAASAAPVAAQSLFSTRGLGVPMRPVDARAATLGGIGVGLIGFNTSLTNPAELAGITQRGVSAALQPVSTSFDVDGAEDGTSATRFPLIAVIYPLSGRLVTSVGYGSFLEQSWGVLTQSTEVIGGNTYTITDVLRSRGGVAQARLSAAYSVTPSLAVGAGAGLLTGNVTRQAARAFVDSAGLQFRTFNHEFGWRYSGVVGVVGARWDLLGRVRLAGSAMFGGDVTATGFTDDSEDRTYGGPRELSAGASARVSPLLLATGGAVWSRMPTTDGPVESRETLRVGGGLEYQGVRSGVRTYPLRLGAHYAELPYHRTGAGVGFLLGDAAAPAAVADIGIERGRRTGLNSAAGDELSESLWRFSVSLSLFAR